METAALAERLSALDSPGGGSEPEELSELVAIVERLHTMIAIETAGLDATGELTADGYRSPAGFLAGDGGRLGRGTARRYLASGRVLEQFSLLAAAAEAGEITFDHVSIFARLLPASASEHRRACVARDEAKLVAAAKCESASGFSGWCVSWRSQVDPDDQLEQRLAREDHGMTVDELDAGTSELTLRGTSGEIEQLRSAINRLTDEAWRAQRNATGNGEASTDAGDSNPGATGSDDAREAPSGDLADVALSDGAIELSRERRQPSRGRLQSQAAAELASRALAGGCGGAKPLVVVVMDWDTFNSEAERFATGTAAPLDVSAHGFRSETIDGHPVPPEEAFLLALRGQVQRCVIGAESLKIDLGREQRLFNAAGRRAVQIRDRSCVHPACDLPALWADIDHIIDWVLHGRTDIDNGQALCRHHHLQKHRAARTAPGEGMAA